MDQAPAVCAIIPPYILRQLAEHGTAGQREAALHTLAISAAIRETRAAIGPTMRLAAMAGPGLAAAAAAPEQISVYDAKTGSTLPGTLRRRTGQPPVADPAVNQAYDGADETYQFYRDVLGRNSVDDRGLPLVSSVHYERGLDNAFWNGHQMVYGDGSGQLMEVGSLTGALDVIGHELTHGVTQYTAALDYHGQSGALNESVSDCFGSLVKQYHLKQTATEADWLIGAGIMIPALGGVALRSMKAPGTAYAGDPQPASMAGYKNMPDDDANDYGGVHTNSGIPNRAFYLASSAIGGFAWEGAGRIWYRALTTKFSPTTNFAQAAQATIAAATELYGPASKEATAVHDAWHTVGVI